MNNKEFKLKGFNSSERSKPLPMMEKISRGLNIPSGCGCEEEYDND